MGTQFPGFINARLIDDRQRYFRVNFAVCCSANWGHRGGCFGSNSTFGTCTAYFRSSPESQTFACTAISDAAGPGCV